MIINNSSIRAHKDEFEKRYQSMLESDFGMFSTDKSNYDVINFDNQSHYNVSVNQKRIPYYCDCPDYQRRCMPMGIPCKHILFVLDNQDIYRRRGNELKSFVNQLINNFKEENNK